MLRATFNNTAVDRAVIEIIQPLSLKNTYLQMLLHLNADFDDDLLLDALQLMQCV